MTAITPEELVKALTTAHEGSQDLDIAIIRFISHTNHEFWKNWAGSSHKFTQSYDVALTLLPDDPTNEITGKADFILESTNGGLTISAKIGNTDRVFADTLPLAVCAACISFLYLK